MDLFRKTMKPVEQVLKDAGVKKDEVDEVRAHHAYIDNLILMIIFIDRPRWWFYSYPQGSAAPQGVFRRQGTF